MLYSGVVRQSENIDWNNILVQAKEFIKEDDLNLNSKPFTFQKEIKVWKPLKVGQKIFIPK